MPLLPTQPSIEQNKQRERAITTLAASFFQSPQITTTQSQQYQKKGKKEITTTQWHSHFSSTTHKTKSNTNKNKNKRKKNRNREIKKKKVSNFPFRSGRFGKTFGIFEFRFEFRKV
jgi:protoheme ferro-lyase